MGWGDNVHATLWVSSLALTLSRHATLWVSSLVSFPSFLFGVLFLSTLPSRIVPEPGLCLVFSNLTLRL